MWCKGSLGVVPDRVDRLLGIEVVPNGRHLHELLGIEVVPYCVGTGERVDRFRLLCIKLLCIKIVAQVVVSKIIVSQVMNRTYERMAAGSAYRFL